MLRGFGLVGFGFVCEPVGEVQTGALEERLVPSGATFGAGASFKAVGVCKPPDVDVPGVFDSRAVPDGGELFACVHCLASISAVMSSRFVSSPSPCSMRVRAGVDRR